MTTIKLKVVDENIEFVSTPPVYSGDIKTIDTKFEFGENWNGFTKTAVFYNDITKPYHQIMENDICYIPHEVMQKEGRIFLGVFGVKGDKVKTSEVVYYDIGQGVITGAGIAPPSDDIWIQILGELETFRQLVEDVQIGEEMFKNQVLEVLKKYGDFFIMMNIGEYIEIKDRRAGSMYFNATERIDNTIQQVVVMKEGGYIPPAQRQEEQMYFNTTATTEGGSGGIKASPFVGVRIVKGV